MTTISTGSSYAPVRAEVVLAMRETHDVTTFRLELDLPQKQIDYMPGQFMLLSILGVGECPISISSSPSDGPWIELTVRRVGRITAALHRGPVAGTLGLRGPFGRGFDMQRLRDRPLLCIAGGLGLAPLRGLIHYINAHRPTFGPLALIYGARTAEDRLFKDELESWAAESDRLIWQVVEQDIDGAWRGALGQVTPLVEEMATVFGKSPAVLCGPSPMLSPVVQALQEQGVRGDDIHIAMERRMSCGIGKCGHCYMGEKLVCVDGPVFTVDALRRLGEPI